MAMKKGGISPGKGGKVKTAVSGNPKVIASAKQTGSGKSGADKTPYSSAKPKG